MNTPLPLVLSFCTVTGLFAGERYNVSVYAVTTKGISKPSSLLVYSEEKSKLQNMIVFLITFLQTPLLDHIQLLCVYHSKPLLIIHNDPRFVFSGARFSTSPCVAPGPLSGPKVSVVDHKAGRVLIQWEELPVACQRGFITSYTIYVRTLSSSLGEHNSKLLD